MAGLPLSRSETVSVSPRACLIDDTCTTAAVRPSSQAHPKKLSVASVLQPASLVFGTAQFLALCG